jgi:hypothetical protein
VGFYRPCGSPSQSSNLTFAAGQTSPNQVTVRSADRSICFLDGATNLLVDLGGFAPGTTTVPSRFLDPLRYGWKGRRPVVRHRRCCRHSRSHAAAIST